MTVMMTSVYHYCVFNDDDDHSSKTMKVITNMLTGLEPWTQSLDRVKSHDNNCTTVYTIYGTVHVYGTIHKI